jgi:UTP:GlnB (protein PII) uridylyltransferase
VRFDDRSSPWYTLCEVRSPDRRGLLHDLAAGLASAGADVHSARLATIAGQAVDRFELTDRNGRKLDEVMQANVTRVLRDGVRRRRLRGRRR